MSITLPEAHGNCTHSRRRDIEGIRVLVPVVLVVPYTFGYIVEKWARN